MLFATDDRQFLLGEVLEGRKIGLDDLVEIGRAEGAVRHAGQQRVGPSLEELLAVPGKLKLPLQLFVGDARAREITVRLRYTPIGERRR